LLPFFCGVAGTFAAGGEFQTERIGGGCVARGASVTKCPVDLPPRALRRTLRWIERIADTLTGVVEAATGAFGWPFPVACAQAEGEHGQDRQQGSHCGWVLCAAEMSCNHIDGYGFRTGLISAPGSICASSIIGNRAEHLVMRLTIRHAVPEDEASVVALWRACDLVASYNDPAADFRFARAGACSDVLVGEDATGRISGSVMVGHDGHRGWLYYVAAAPYARARGIGRQMVQAAEEWLRQRGVVKAQLLVRETNTKVVSFYEHLGFEVAPRVVMGKWLDQPG
jgi:ribosomal protein S18 acetylase RimI-like enzyme